MQSFHALLNTEQTGAGKEFLGTYKNQWNENFILLSRDTDDNPGLVECSENILKEKHNFDF